MSYNRFLPLIVPVLSFLYLEIYYNFPRMIYVAIILLLLLFFFTARQFIAAGKKHEKWWSLIILPSLFTVGLIGYTTLIYKPWVSQALILFNVVFLYLYFRSLYYFVVKEELYKKGDLENFSAYGNFLSFYFIASTVFGFQIFLNISTWKLMLVIVATVALIVYQVSWANKIDKKVGAFYILISCLILTELAWSISFLTLSYYILGLILAVAYYILIGLIRFYLLGKFDKKIVKLYLIYGFLSILIVLLTARWI